MTPLEERLRRDLPELADHLTSDRGRATNLAPSQRRAWLAPLAAVAALLVVAAGAYVVLSDGSSDADLVATDRPALTPLDPQVWHVSPDAPIEPRSHAATGWIDGEAIFWAGSSLDRSNVEADGAAYNPSTDTWRVLPTPGWGHPGLVSAFDDRYVYVVAKGSGSRYDPTDGTSTDLPPVADALTVSTSLGVVAPVVADDRVFFVASSVRGDLQVVEYLPATNTWVEGDTAATTFDSDAFDPITGTPPLWTGSEIVLWASAGVGRAYDPSTDVWRELRVSPANSTVVASRAAVTDSGLAVVAQLIGGPLDGSTHVLVVDELDAGSSWLTPTVGWDTRTPVQEMAVAGAGPYLTIASAEGIAVYDMRSGGPVLVPFEEGLLTGVVGTSTVWTGSELIVWGGEPAQSPAFVWSPPRP